MTAFVFNSKLKPALREPNQKVGYSREPTVQSALPPVRVATNPSVPSIGMQVSGGVGCVTKDHLTREEQRLIDACGLAG